MITCNFVRSWLTVGVVLALGGRALAQQPIEAEVTYFHRGKQMQETARGMIVEETPGVVTWRVAGRIEKIPAGDVREVFYQPSADLARQDLRRAQKYEEGIDKAADPESRRQAVRQAIDLYQKVLPQLGDARYAQRHAAFKIAQLTTRLAEDDPSQSNAAIAALGAFVKEHGTGWQVGRASWLLSQMQMEQGDLAAAQKTLDGLAQKPDLARETRVEYETLVARTLLRGERFAEAQQRLKATRSRLLPEETQAIAKVDVYLAGCQGGLGQLAGAEKQLKAVLEGDADLPLKALACNTLADAYRKAGRSEDAFWRYLMVDVLYNQDPEEHARALYHLSRLFDQVRKDAVRAQEYRDRLLHEKQFADAEYRRLALKGGG